MIFWPILRGFWFTPSYALWVTPQSSATLNVLQRYIIMVSFISVAFVIVKLEIFKCFRGDAASMKWPLLGGFWALSPANMTRVCWNFDQRYVFHKTKTVSEQSFKIKCLSGIETYPKLIVLVHFWAQFPPQKNQTFFQKLHPYDYQVIHTGPRSHINHRILIKLILEKKHFLGQIWTF